MEVACKGPTALPDSRGLKWPGSAPLEDIGIAALVEASRLLDLVLLRVVFIRPHCRQRRV